MIQDVKGSDMVSDMWIVSFFTGQLISKGSVTKSLFNNVSLLSSTKSKGSKNKELLNSGIEIEAS